MAVRRLAPAEQQPDRFAFSGADLEWAKRQIAKYPEGRQASAVIPLLWRAQEQAGGWVPQKAIEHVADLLAMPTIRVLEIATFYTMFNLAPVGRHHVQVCGTTPCVLRGAEDIKHVCEKRIGHTFHVTPDGALSWEEVECLGSCVNAPLVQIGAARYEDLTTETFTKLLDDLVAGRPVREGPQVDRRFSAPLGGATTLRSFDTGAGPAPGEHPVPQEPVLTDAEAKRPGEAAKLRDAPIPTGPVADASSPRTAGLVEELEPPARVADEHAPALLERARGGGPDDLKLIWGVGPKLEEMLHRMGVFHFDQIAGWTEMNLRWVDQNLGAFRGRAVRDQWIAQAAKLATGWRPKDPDGEKPTDL